jgi:sugar-specific transcriptional regulator TrmB
MFVGLQQTIQDLQYFGLSNLQAIVYITVVRLGSAKASDIARESKVNRPEVYRILTSLQNNGLIEILYGRPIRFLPTPPEKALSVLTQNIKDKLVTLETKKDEIIFRLKSIQGKKDPDPIGLKVIVGRKRTYQKILEMLLNADKEIRYATSAKGLKREYEEGIIDELFKCSKKDVKIKFLTEINTPKKILTKIYRIGCELKQLQQLPFHMLIVDDDQVLVGAIVKDDKVKQANANVNLWLNSKEFVEIIKSSFKESWRKSSFCPKKNT